MSDGLFRKKAMDRITSPDELNDYIKAAPISVWLVLSAVVVFLVGVCIWGFLGHVDTLVDGILYVKDGYAVAYVRDADCDRVLEDMPVRANGAEYTVNDVAWIPVHLESSSPETSYLLHMLDDDVSDEWVYEVILKDAESGVLPDGVYTATILIDSVRPFSFIVN